MSEGSYFANSVHVTELSPKDFDKTKSYKLTKKGNFSCSAVLFYAPWCPYCKKVKDSWEKLGEVVGYMDVYAFDCDKYSDHRGRVNELVPNLIPGYPTMIVFKNGEPKENIGLSEDGRSVASLQSDASRLCQKYSK